MYVTYDEPLSSAYTPNNELYETCVWLGCVAAKGKTDELDVFNAIWNKIQTMNVTTKDNRLLSYWGNGANTGSYFTTDDLLKHGDGRCGAWARFTNSVFNSQGIQCELVGYKHKAYKKDNVNPGIFFRNGICYFLKRIVQNANSFQSNGNLENVYFPDHAFNKITINGTNYFIDTTCKNSNKYSSAQSLIENTIYLEVIRVADNYETTLSADFDEFYMPTQSNP